MRWCVQSTVPDIVSCRRESSERREPETVNIAIVEADRVLADVMVFAAKRRGHRAISFDERERVVERLPFSPDALIVGMQGQEAGEVAWLEQTKKAYPHLNLFITVEQPIDPMPVRLLRAGAREVIRTPFNPTELVLAIEAMAEVGAVRSDTESLKVGDLTVALDQFQATKNSHTLDLTNLEMRLLYCLCQHSPQIASLERLLTFGWGVLADADQSLIKTHMSHIRRKIESAGGQACEIRSRPAVGYQLLMTDTVDATQTDVADDADPKARGGHPE